MSKTVVGNYETANEALRQIEYLREQGYPMSSISVIANSDAAYELRDSGATIERDFQYVNDTTDETLWERIKAFFGRDDEDTMRHEASLDSYRDSIRNGNVLVLVDEDLVPVNMETDYGMKHADLNVDSELDANAYVNYDNRDEDELRLREERMDVEKHSVQAGEAIIRKRVVEEMKTIDVPVMHEELVIERHAVNDEAADYNNFDEETITIPLMEEQVEVSKHAVVTEDVKLHKREIEGSQSVSETLRREELEVDRDGNTVIVDENRVR